MKITGHYKKENDKVSLYFDESELIVDKMLEEEKTFTKGDLFVEILLVNGKYPERINCHSCEWNYDNFSSFKNRKMKNTNPK